MSSAKRKLSPDYQLDECFVVACGCDQRVEDDKFHCNCCHRNISISERSLDDHLSTPTHEKNADTLFAARPNAHPHLAHSLRKVRKRECKVGLQSHKNYVQIVEGICKLIQLYLFLCNSLDRCIRVPPCSPFRVISQCRLRQQGISAVVYKQLSLWCHQIRCNHQKRIGALW